jgi:hypothetical protein
MPEKANHWKGGILEITVVVLTVCAALYHFSYVTADPDLWGHIKFGQAHWESGQLARTDNYSFTASGREWVNHEWLTELAFALIFDRFADTGLLALEFIHIRLLTVLLIFPKGKENNQYLLWKI